jgi:hypothetical protein
MQSPREVNQEQFETRPNRIGTQYPNPKPESPDQIEMIPDSKKTKLQTRRMNVEIQSITTALNILNEKLEELMILRRIQRCQRKNIETEILHGKESAAPHAT